MFMLKYTLVIVHHLNCVLVSVVVGRETSETSREGTRNVLSNVHRGESFSHTIEDYRSRS